MGDVFEQVEGAGLVGADDEAAGGIVAQLGEGVGHFAGEVFKAAGVVEDDVAGVGDQQVLPGTIEQLFVEIGFELGDGEGDGGLGAEELFGRAGEALLGDDGEEDLKRVQLHK